jgi:hypothetical protein
LPEKKYLLSSVHDTANSTSDLSISAKSSYLQKCLAFEAGAQGKILDLKPEVKIRKTIP